MQSLQGDRVLAILAGNRAGSLLSDSADAARVLYCRPSQANAVAKLRGYMVEDCGIVGVGVYDARSHALR
jgi:hypothetical protein